MYVEEEIVLVMLIKYVCLWTVSCLCDFPEDLGCCVTSDYK